MKKSSTDVIEEDSNKPETKTTKSNNNSEDLSLQTFKKDEADIAKKESITTKSKTEKKNIAYTFPAHEETFVMEDKDVDHTKTNHSTKEKGDTNYVQEPKPPQTKKKLIKSPRRVKPVKVCLTT